MTKGNNILRGKELNAKLKSLTEAGGDEDWNIYYVDPEGAKWCKSYPNSGYHGGGEPELRQVEKFPWDTNEIQ